MGGLTTWSRFKHSHRIATSASPPTHTFSHRQPLHHPVFCFLFPSFPVCVCECVWLLSGIHSHLWSVKILPRSFPSMHARRAYMHVRTCHVQIAGCRLTVVASWYTAKRIPENASFWKNDDPPSRFHESCIFQYSSSPAFFFLLLLCCLLDRAKYFIIFWLPNIRGPIMVIPEGRWNNHHLLGDVLIERLLLEYIFNIRV